MNDSQFEHFLAERVEALKRKNRELEEQYGLGHFARWDHDGERDQLTFANPNEEAILRADTTGIGSYSLNTKTWLWAWANKSLTDAARAKAIKLKELFDVTGMRAFQDPHIECDEYMAWELAAISVEYLGGQGCYRGPAGHLWAFWCIDSITVTRPAND